MLLCSNSSLAVWVRLNRMCATCLLLVVWRGCFIISWDKIWSQLLIDLNSPDMTVNPNPLCRAQWLFSTSFFLLWLSTDKPSHGSAVVICCLFCSPMEPQLCIHCTLVRPARGRHRFLAADLLSVRNAQPKIITLSSREKRKVFLLFENSPHFVYVWYGDEWLWPHL